MEAHPHPHPHPHPFTSPCASLVRPSAAHRHVLISDSACPSDATSCTPAPAGKALPSIHPHATRTFGPYRQAKPASSFRPSRSHWKDARARCLTSPAAIPRLGACSSYEPPLVAAKEAPKVHRRPADVPHARGRQRHPRDDTSPYRPSRFAVRLPPSRAKQAESAMQEASRSRYFVNSLRIKPTAALGTNIPALGNATSHGNQHQPLRWDPASAIRLGSQSLEPRPLYSQPTSNRNHRETCEASAPVSRHFLVETWGFYCPEQAESREIVTPGVAR